MNDLKIQSNHRNQSSGGETSDPEHATRGEVGNSWQAPNINLASENFKLSVGSTELRAQVLPLDQGESKKRKYARRSQTGARREAEPLQNFLRTSSTTAYPRGRSSFQRNRRAPLGRFLRGW